MKLLATVAGLVLVVTASASAETPNPMFETRDVVSALAFDPSKFFQEENGQDLVRFAYRGDDYGWPVYSIAIRNGCLNERTKECHMGRRARMVRAPVIEKMERPRWRGTALIGKVSAQKPANPYETAKVLDTVGMEWMEADLVTCPGAMEVLAEGNSLIWVTSETLKPTPETEFELVLHADTITVEFPYYLRQVRYQGYLAKRSPAAWADKLAKTLDPCWKPASAPVPWHIQEKTFR
ncbi:hypothetical protein OVA03_16165 [Asticcacaulis sp. SL142]|uniref:hypothetical protein n=1 Tax=Asticcacaulis sp. SL142 TaxID=2995155 RepID=UPI00226CA99F|nr:hypothetical protein [Asticcacaulis sp. SL142]WAC48204.1 hypothetical protein OVA03_16165 [Asticcacaulis sp. SL142]